MAETLEEKIERLYKYVDEWAAPNHTHDLIIDIKNELDNGASIDNEHEKILLDCMDKLLDLASLPPAYCKCGHEMIEHVSFRDQMTTGCRGLDSTKQPCQCRGFDSNL